MAPCCHIVHAPAYGDLPGVRYRDLMQGAEAPQAAGGRAAPARPAAAHTSARTGLAVLPAVVAGARREKACARKGMACAHKLPEWDIAAAGNHTAAAGSRLPAAQWAWPREHHYSSGHASLPGTRVAAHDR